MGHYFKEAPAYNTAGTSTFDFGTLQRPQRQKGKLIDADDGRTAHSAPRDGRSGLFHPLPPLAEADPLLARLLRDMAGAAQPYPPSVTSSSLRQSRIRRIGFAEQAASVRPPGEPIDVMARTFTRPDELAAYIRAGADPPTELIGFEFSGAILLARRAQGVVAISADVRPAEHDGLHYLGCVQDIIHVRVWDRAYMFPPCF